MLVSRMSFLPLALLLALVGERAAGGEQTGPAPQAARDRYAEGEVFEKDGKLKEAAAAYEDAIRLGMTKFPRTYLRVAAVYERLGDYASAADRYSVVLDVIGMEGSCRD